MKAMIIIFLVVAVLIGGILTLRSSRGTGMPGSDVLDRARQREREQEAVDKKDEQR